MYMNMYVHIYVLYAYMCIRMFYICACVCVCIPIVLLILSQHFSSALSQEDNDEAPEGRASVMQSGEELKVSMACLNY